MLANYLCHLNLNPRNVIIITYNEFCYLKCGLVTITLTYKCENVMKFKLSYKFKPFFKLLGTKHVIITKDNMWLPYILQGVTKFDRQKYLKFYFLCALRLTR